MAQTLAALAINLQANSAQLVQHMRQASESVQRFGDRVAVVSKRAVALYAIVQGAKAIGDASNSIIAAAATFETLNGSLETVYGSQEIASRKFKELTDFAAATPFTLDQVTEAAIKMRALGLDPSIASIESMGNTASAMGKPLMQFVESVADAATGEMERLKEFGIRASKEGDNVIFTFQNVETKIKNNAEDIQSYLIALGQTKFGGAIAAQADTLNGVFAQAQGAAMNLANAFSEKTGLAKSVKESTKWFTQMINKATEFINGVGAPDSVEAMKERIEEITKLTTNRGIYDEDRGLTTTQKVRLRQLNEEKRLLQEIIAAREDSARKEQEIIDNQVAQEAAQMAARRAEIDEKKRLEEQADAAIAEQKRITGLFGGNPAEKLEQLEQQFLTENQLIQNEKIKQLALLERLRHEDLLSETRYHDLKAKVVKKAYDDEVKLQSDKDRRKRDIETRNQRATISATASLLGMLGEKNKAFAIGEAIINTYLGVSRTLAAYPYPYNLVPAALHLAQGVAQVNAIRSGGGATISGGGSVPDVPTADGVEQLAANDEPAQTKTITIAIDGDSELLPRSVLRELADELNSLDESNVRISV